MNQIPSGTWDKTAAWSSTARQIHRHRF